MTTVAIIAEYNPFHLGHEYHIKKIREEFGADTAIVAIMSGNYTQRGELAITDKHIRAKCACISGINLVLELPFPFSMSSADFFARSGIKIANSLGVVDYLSFGTECGDSNIIRTVAKTMLDDAFSKVLREVDDKTLGYAKKCEIAVKRLLPDTDFEFTPNNILALEYAKALITSKSKIKIHTVKRQGQKYLDAELNCDGPASALAIREALLSGDTDKIYEKIPSASGSIISAAIDSGDMPTSQCGLDNALISHFRINPNRDKDILDTGDGLYNRLVQSAQSASNISCMLKLSETKKYTNARIRRAMWYSFFGVTSSDMKALPAYTQILALDSIGAALLHSIKGWSDVQILTKPAAIDGLSDAAKSQKELSDRADSIFELAKPTPKSGKSVLTLSPFVKK